MSQGNRSSPSRAANAALGLAGVWIVVVVFVIQVSSWLQPVTNRGASVNTPSALLNALESGLIALPLLLMGRLLSNPRSRSTVRAWLLAALYPLALAPTHLIAPAESQLTLLAQVVVALVLALVLSRLATNVNAPNMAGAGLAAGAAALVALPWLALGALGSPLDTLLSLALGLLVGIGAARIITSWLAVREEQGVWRGGTIWTGGFPVGILLLILASPLISNGGQFSLMLALPALGWACVALAYAFEGVNWRPVAALVGLVIATAVAFTDTDSTSIIANDPMLARILQAGGLAVLIAWLLGLAAIIWRARWGGAQRGMFWLIGAAVLWAGAFGFYQTSGMPGFFGDDVFVVMKSQADTTQASTIANYDQRRQFVYRTLTEHANQTQADLRASLDRFGIGYQPFYLVNGLEVRGGLLARLLLVTRSDVERVMPSPHLRPLPSLPTPMEGLLGPPQKPAWNLTNIGADRVWNELGVRGKGIVIGQSDSGVQGDHPELEANYRGRSDNNYNWLDPWSGSEKPIDAGGHGTHTLGSIVGKHVGVAPDAQWFGCVNLQRNVGNPALYLTCMQFMLAPYPLHGDPLRDGDPTRSANVLNNSWGCPQEFEGCDPASLRPAVRALLNAGIFVVASAGNDGPRCSTVTDPLAIYDEAFSVGAVDFQNNLGDFSSVGPVTVDGSGRVKPDILAPGVQVLSGLPGSTYDTLDGTSMAGPHVVGVVALMWSANPALVGDIARTRQILIETATPFTGTLTGGGEAAPGDACVAQTNLGQRPNVVAGYGIVNAYEAVKGAQAIR